MDEVIVELLSSLMEEAGYQDCAAPPITHFHAFPQLIKEDASQGSFQKVCAKRHERSRRDRMSELYSKLQHLVPDLLPKESRERIVAATISYIKDLEKSIEELEALKEREGRKALALDSKAAAPLLTDCSSVNVTLTGSAALFGIQSVIRPGLASRILQVFETQSSNVEVLAASASCTDQILTVTITAMVPETGDVESVVQQLKADLRALLP